MDPHDQVCRVSPGTQEADNGGYLLGTTEGACDVHIIPWYYYRVLTRSPSCPLNPGGPGTPMGPGGPRSPVDPCFPSAPGSP